jgi:hypothetical protein
MVAFRGQPVILLFKDGLGRFQSTNLLTVMGDVTSSNSCFPNLPGKSDSEKPQQPGLSRQAVIGIVASIAGVVTLLSFLIAAHLFLRYRRGRRIHMAMQHKGIEGGPGFTQPGVTPPPDPQSIQPQWNAVIINKPIPYPMEKYTNWPSSPHFAQSTSNDNILDSTQQMQSLNAATADLDQILNASVFVSHGGDGLWSSSLSPSTPYSRDVLNAESSIGTKEQPKAAIPKSPLSSASNFRDSIIPTDYTRGRSAGGDPGIGGGRDGNATRRSSNTLIISGRGATDRGGQDGYGGTYF